MATKFEKKNLPLSNVKTSMYLIGDFFQIFVVFSENMNFFKLFQKYKFKSVYMSIPIYFFIKDSSFISDVTMRTKFPFLRKTLKTRKQG